MGMFDFDPSGFRPYTTEPYSRSRPRRKQFSKKVRESLYCYQKKKCEHCKTSLRLGDLQVDHIKAWVKTNDDNYDNLQLLCAQCNKNKSSKPNSRAIKEGIAEGRIKGAAKKAAEAKFAKKPVKRKPRKQQGPSNDGRWPI